MLGCYDANMVITLRSMTRPPTRYPPAPMPTARVGGGCAVIATSHGVWWADSRHRCWQAGSVRSLRRTHGLRSTNADAAAGGYYVAWLMVNVDNMADVPGVWSWESLDSEVYRSSQQYLDDEGLTCRTQATICPASSTRSA